MTNRIRTYNDLLEEKKKLEVLLSAQKELIRYDVQQLKTELQPAMNTIGLVGKMFTRDRSHALLNTGANTVIDLLFKKLILGRAGWITRMLVPFFVKNISSHVIAGKNSGMLQKFASWFRHKRHNGQATPDPDPASTRVNPDDEAH